MAHRNVHYEAAFEDYLRSKGCPYVAVDEARKALQGDSSLKSFDFLVYGEAGANLLVDVKGRKFPAGRAGAPSSRAWENWITTEDADSLRQWERIFGDAFRAVIVFAYWLQGPPLYAPFEEVHCFRGRHYAFVVMGVREYVAAAHRRSRRWGTLAIAGRRLAARCADIGELLFASAPCGALHCPGGAV